MDANDDQTLRRLLDEYLRMYASRDDQLTTHFSEDFSGFTGGGDFLVKKREEWVAITRQDFAQVKDPIVIELKDVALQSLAENVAVATSFFTIHLPIKDHVLSRETARLVLIFRKEPGGWKISHSSISIPYGLVREGEVYPLNELVDRNRYLEELITERTIQLSEANRNLQQTNEDLAREITKHKAVEADKERLATENRQLQKSESLGRMAGAIAHTFNNQLGAVIGNLELALMALPPGPGLASNLTAAMQAAEKAAGVSGQMLTYLGQSLGERQMVDLAQVCLRATPMMQALLPSGVLLQTRLPTPGPCITANVEQIQQVLSNLITNAWEAMGENPGSIDLEVQLVPRAAVPAGHRYPLHWQPEAPAYACLRLTDTGCGIASKDFENLFDPFFSSKFAGRGLGLAVALGIVRAHGGAMTVESKPGRGSTFGVYLPLSTQSALPRATAPLTLGSAGSVLLVEDEAMMRETAAGMLTTLGLTVLEAKDGPDAIEIFRQRHHEIQVVLCDLTMPGLDGWQTLAALRQIAPGLPVILASGYDKAHVMSGDHSQWPQVFLGKPYRLKALREAISQALVPPRPAAST